MSNFEVIPKIQLKTDSQTLKRAIEDLGGTLWERVNYLEWNPRADGIVLLDVDDAEQVVERLKSMGCRPKES